MIHANSIAAYRSEQPRISRRAQQIIAWLEIHPRKTDREIMQGMGFSDMNSVRPRVTELVDSGRLVEVGEKVCPVTRKTVRIVDLSLDEKGRRQDERQDAA
jgi:predicted HTH transcriptional regulator